MVQIPSQRKLREIFSDIIAGHSVSYFNSAPIYIKHLNNLDIAEIDYQYNYNLQEGIKKGLPTQEEKTKYLIENDLWDKKDEDKLDELIKTKGTFILNKGNEYLRSKRKMWDDQIAQIEKDIKVIQYKKLSLVGTTAESYATRKSNDEYIITSFYSDKELKNKFFDNINFYDLNNEENNEIMRILDDFITNFNQDNIKRISLSSFFANMFSLCPEDITKLYGKSIIYLTLYQMDCYRFAAHFRNMINSLNITLPPEMMEDPDKLMEYLECNAQYRKIEEKMGDKNTVSLLGAKNEDLDILGIQRSKKDLGKELKKKGGSMTGQEMMDAGLL